MPCLARTDLPLSLSQIKSGHSDDGDRPGSGGRQYSRPAGRREGPGHPCSMIDECARRCTTTFENAHRTALREVLYRHHPWVGRRVCVHQTADKADNVVFRCTLEGSQAERWLEVPAWMFNRTACANAERLTAQSFVSIDALAALSVLLELALLKDRTPSVVLLSGASRASHDQNRGKTHVTQERNAKEGIPTQSTTAAAASDRSVRRRPVKRRHRRARMAGAAGGSAGSSHEPDDAVDPRPCCDDSDASREGG
jgi:hypothetical protein